MGRTILVHSYLLTSSLDADDTFLRFTQKPFVYGELSHQVSISEASVPRTVAYLVIRCAFDEVIAVEDIAQEDGQLHVRKVPAKARTAEPSTQVSPRHGFCRPYRGPIENGANAFCIAALSPRDHRSGMKSSASSPQMVLSRCRVYVGTLTIVPGANVCPRTVSPLSGTTRGRPIPTVENKRSPSLMTSWRYGKFFRRSYVPAASSSSPVGAPRAASSSRCSLSWASWFLARYVAMAALELELMLITTVKLSGVSQHSLRRCISTSDK